MPLTAVKSLTGKDALLAATLRVLDRDGLDALSLRAVGREAGVSAPSVYWHFADKAALLAAVLRAVATGFVADVRARADAVPRGERLAAAGEAFIDFVIAHPHRFQLLFRQPVKHSRKTLRSPAPSPDSSFGILVETARDGMTARTLRVDDPVSVALTIAALGQGLVILLQRDRFADHEEFAAFARVSFRRLLRGLAP